MNLLDVTGRVFDVQRFSLHDGPGIRTLLFLKGCRLRCAWCCNPESQSPEVQTMTVQGKPQTLGRNVRVGDLLAEALLDVPYYRRSGGGVTLSGGEALLQASFAAALLEACKAEGLHTAVETAGFAAWDAFEQALPWTDLFLFDVKHMDGAQHRAFTGQDNVSILENARRLAPLARAMTVRVPVIPGFNDTPEAIRAIAAFAASLRGVSALHLLPYHRLGRDKYEGLGRPYPMGDTPPPDAAWMERLLETAAASGLSVQIGG